MGTRADFYVGRGKNAEWLGSVAMDGYPEGIPMSIKYCYDEGTYRHLVRSFLGTKSHATTPDQGWPWPWDDSGTTDYSYAFDDGACWAACFGYFWHPASEEMPDEESHPEMWETNQCEFPDMSHRKNVNFGERSGLIFIRKLQGS